MHGTSMMTHFSSMVTHTFEAIPWWPFIGASVVYPYILGNSVMILFWCIHDDPFLIHGNPYILGDFVMSLFRCIHDDPFSSMTTHCGKLLDDPILSSMMTHFSSMTPHFGKLLDDPILSSMMTHFSSMSTHFGKLLDDPFLSHDHPFWQIAWWPISHPLRTNTLIELLI